MKSELNTASMHQMSMNMRLRLHLHTLLQAGCALVQERAYSGHPQMQVAARPGAHTHTHTHKHTHTHTQTHTRTRTRTHTHTHLCREGEYHKWQHSSTLQQEGRPPS